uniref:Uncharacterized protein n=1 Tax=Oryza brachyantha TaxID=4533 RepID=J3M6W9_ORYBR
MEVEMMEDDVFFAELSKRISLLITDDDESTDFGAGHFPGARAAAAAAPIPFKRKQKDVGDVYSWSISGFSLAHVPMGASMVAPPAYTLYHHAASYNSIGAGGDSAAVRAWQQQQCGSKGTGVFIPRSSPGSVHPKKKGKSKGNVHKAKMWQGSGIYHVRNRRSGFRQQAVSKKNDSCGHHDQLPFGSAKLAEEILGNVQGVPQPRHS